LCHMLLYSNFSHFPSEFEVHAFSVHRYPPAVIFFLSLSLSLSLSPWMELRATTSIALQSCNYSIHPRFLNLNFSSSLSITTNLLRSSSSPLSHKGQSLLFIFAALHYIILYFKIFGYFFIKLFIFFSLYSFYLFLSLKSIIRDNFHKIIKIIIRSMLYIAKKIMFPLHSMFFL
jgi:hypothetical protein